MDNHATRNAPGQQHAHLAAPAIELALMCLGHLPLLQKVDARSSPYAEMPFAAAAGERVPRMANILAYITGHSGPVTRQDIKCAIGCSEHSVSSALARLRSKGLITGRRLKNTWHYEVCR